ncbi:MAG: hypothetical protein IKM04_03755 [Clostridia bacterium]|nr:hypothetical protein [Clostridia bacterium]
MKIRIFAVFAVLVLLLSACGGKTPTDSVVLPEEAWIPNPSDISDIEKGGPSFSITSSEPERSYRVTACAGALFTDAEDYYERTDSITLVPGQEVTWTGNCPQDPDRIATGVGFDRVNYDTYIEIVVFSGEDAVGYGLIAVDVAPENGFSLRDSRIETFDKPIEAETVEKGLEILKEELKRY